MISHLSVFARHRAARANGIIFAASGLLLGSWAALIPFIKTKFNLDEAQLGLLLLSLPAGVTLTNLLSVPIINRFGPVKTTLVALLLTGLFFILPFGMPNVWLSAFFLLLVGAAFACTNVAMNTCASQLEQHSGLRIMSTCHGLWSAGMTIGSIMAGLLTAWGVAPWVYFGLLAMVELAVVVLLRHPLSEVPEDEPEPKVTTEKPSGFMLPNQALWVLIIISSCVNLTEGAMADWSAVYMREVVLAPEVMVGWGFAVYAFFMAGGRFLGDALLAKYSSGTVLRAGGFIAASGLMLAVLIPGTVTALIGFAMAGAGVSLGSPILYAAAAKVPGMAKGAGLATMNTFAMVSFLGGPAVIGFLAKIFSLSLAFALVAVFALVWVWQTGKMR